MKLRHARMRSEPLITTYGILELDSAGYVTNLDKIAASPEQILAYLPGFINADLFPQPEPPPGFVVPPALKEDTVKPTEASEETYAKIIKKLLDTGAPTTSSGLIDMATLNDELRKLNLRNLTGTERAKISETYSLKRASVVQV